MANAPLQKPCRRIPKFLSISLTLLFLLGALIFAIPSVLSSDWGKKKTVQLLNTYIPGTVRIDQMDLSWFGRQKIEGIRLYDAENKEILRIEAFLTSASLFDFLIRSDFTTYKSELSGLNARIVDEGKGVTNLQRAISSKYPGKKSSSQFEVELKNVNGFLLPGPAAGKLSFQLNGSTLKNGVEGRFDIGAKLNGHDLHRFIEGNLSNEEVQLTAKVEHFPVLIVDQLLTIFQPGLHGILLEALGDQIDIEIDQSLHNGRLVFQFNAKSQTFSASVPGIFEQGKLRLNGFGEIACVATPSLLSKGSPKLGLSKPVPVKIILDTLEISLPFDPSQIAVHGKMEAGEARLNLSELNETLAFKSIQGELNYSSNEDPFISITALDVLSNQANIPALNILMTKKETKLAVPDMRYKLDKNSANGGYAITLNNLALTLDPLGKISEWKNVSSIVSKGILSFKNLTLENEKREKIAAIQDGTFPWEVSGPANRVHLGMDGKTFLLQQNTEGSLKGTLIVTNWLKDQASDFSKAHIDGQMKLGQVPIAFLKASAGQIDIEKVLGPTLNLDMSLKGDLNPNNNSSFGSLEMQVSTKELNGNISLNLAKIINFKIGSTSKTLGKLDLKGSIEQFWTEGGDINYPGMILLLEGSSHDFPVGMIGRILSKDPSMTEKIEAVFGTTVNATIYTQLKKMNGPFRFEAEGKNGSALLDGNVDQGVLTLNKNLTAQFNLTPKVSQVVLGKVIPVLGDILSSDRPISINVEKKGFSVPLSPFSISQIQVANGSVDIGKVKFSGEGKLAGVVKFLNASTGSVIPIWCTPLYFNMQQGIVAVERFDMLLLGQYPFAMWGKINFPKDKTDLTLGISGRTIAQAFGVKNLPADLLVQVPLKGTVANPSLDIRKATAKITAIAAQEQGPKGKLIGSILNLAAGGLKEDEAPPPTTNPLPWQNLYEATAEADENKSSIQDVILDPLKEVEKGAANLIKGLIKG